MRELGQRSLRVRTQHRLRWWRWHDKLRTRLLLERKLLFGKHRRLPHPFRRHLRNASYLLPIRPVPGTGRQLHLKLRWGHKHLIPNPVILYAVINHLRHASKRWLWNSFVLRLTILWIADLLVWHAKLRYAGVQHTPAVRYAGVQHTANVSNSPLRHPTLNSQALIARFW